jgi:hypothetical protein
MQSIIIVVFTYGRVTTELKNTRPDKNIYSCNLYGYTFLCQCLKLTLEYSLEIAHYSYQKYVSV